MNARVLFLALPFLLGCSTAAPGTPRDGSLLVTEGQAAAPAPQAVEIRYATETYTLPNGLTVTLHEDHSLPMVVINTWFAVGSKDEEPGRSGFAHLFEHLMFMGTGRVPDNQYDVLMEQAGGSNNASTSNDRTNYYSMGPSSLLPTLLWLDADRLDALDEFMTQEKLDRQREIVRNERRQRTENTPYGESWLLLSEALYPVGHPYHHPVIGSHADLEAATLEDVVAFFRRFYVPANASLVVAGDFDSDEVRAIIERTFGAIPAKPAPSHRTAAIPPLSGETRLVEVDQVEFPKLYLAWHSPAHYATGDAEMDLTATILAEGPSSRLEERLVIETGLAQGVDAFQASRELGSSFHVEALAAPGADLEEIKREILAVLEEYAREGPTEAELERARALVESSFLRGMENLFARADRMNSYRHFFGVADGFQRDLERYTGATRDSVRGWTREVFGPGRVDLRILPAGASIPQASLDERPADFAAGSFTAPEARTLQLSNGITLHVLPRPGAGLFSGQLLVRGGASLVPPEKAGLAALAAALLNSGAGGLDKARFAAAVESLGARVQANAERGWMSVSVGGLTSRLDPTLDRFADVLLRPNLTQADFEREKRLALAGIQARKDDPRSVSQNVARILLFGAEDPRGRPLDGYTETVETVTKEDVVAGLVELVNPADAVFVFAGDLDPEALRADLEARFGSWRSTAKREAPALEPIVAPAPGRIVLVDRPDAPQTVITVLRPLSKLEGVERAARICANTVLGGTFTSRLNANLREDKGYTYGAGSRVLQEGEQVMFYAGSSVRTDVTGASLTELKKELDLLRADGVTEAEVPKAVETQRRRLIETFETTGGLAGALGSLVRNGRPLDAVTRDLAALSHADLENVSVQAKSNDYAWDELLIVLVGDRETIVEQLSAAGFPEPIEADADGRLLTR